MLCSVNCTGRTTSVLEPEGVTCSWVDLQEGTVSGCLADPQEPRAEFLVCRPEYSTSDTTACLNIPRDLSSLLCNTAPCPLTKPPATGSYYFRYLKLPLKCLFCSPLTCQDASFHRMVNLYRSFKMHLLLEASQHPFLTENELTGAGNIAQQFYTLTTQTRHDQEVTLIWKKPVFNLPGVTPGK